MSLLRRKKDLEEKINNIESIYLTKYKAIHFLSKEDVSPYIYKNLLCIFDIYFYFIV